MAAREGEGRVCAGTSIPESSRRSGRYGTLFLSWRSSPSNLATPSLGLQPLLLASNVASYSPLSFFLIPTKNGLGQPNIRRRLRIGHTHTDKHAGVFAQPSEFSSKFSPMLQIALFLYPKFGWIEKANFRATRKALSAESVLFTFLRCHQR